MNWLTENWHSLVPSPWIQPLLVVAATLVGGFIGSDRQRHEKAAGIRTMALVCLGAAVFTMVGFAFGSGSGDASRVAAQIVTGIGFLGGGVIMRGPDKVLGTTTAATIWVVASIGMVIGTGFVGAGLGLGGLVLTVLIAIARWEDTHMAGARTSALVLTFQNENGKSLIKIEKVLSDFGVNRIPEDLTVTTDGRQQLRVKCRLPAHRRVNFLYQLAILPEVLQVES